MPDYSQIHKEMGKNGVTLSLLWAEYCSQCRETGDWGGFEVIKRPEWARKQDMYV